MAEDTERYPYSLKSVLENNTFENIVDSNIFAASLPPDLPVPQIDDPRKTQSSHHQTQRYPGYIRSGQIDQLFNYIGFIKRVKNREYREYLPILYNELKEFLKVLEEIVYSQIIAISEDIYNEQKRGLENFFASYHGRSDHRIKWIEKIWKHQKNYIENVDMLIETLKLSGQVFDYKEDPLYAKIVSFCEDYFRRTTSAPPSTRDVHFVANCFTRAARDNEPKTIWSGDKDITEILKVLYGEIHADMEFPEINQRGNYIPYQYAQMFP
ncbi:hypothetical protein ACFL03_04235 [Thermodesulfobacteriota bacterium]